MYEKNRFELCNQLITNHVNDLDYGVYSNSEV